MGREVETRSYTREQRQRYREKVQHCLDVFEQMLVADSFAFDEPLSGMEIELNLVDRDYRPKMDNASVLAAIADPEYQTELGRFNIEFNVPPAPLAADALTRLEASLRDSLNEAERRSAAQGTHIIMTGILPTVMPETFEGDWMSENVRYAAINDAVLAARGEDIHIDIDGPNGETLTRFVDSVAPESACTSMQLHLQVRPDEFAAHWNAAQVLAGPQLSLAANSPFLMGRQLWAETRIVLFAQATDTRPIEYANQGVRPRVWFGERWITSIFDLFEENARFFPALLPELDPEDPQAVFDGGGTPKLSEMRLHNGTIYRWNRPIYDVSDGTPHLRLENRVLPAGPTIVDTLANAAFYYGTLHSLAHEERPVWSRMAFSTAQANFLNGSRHGIDADLFWPGVGEMPASELILRHLLPLAHAGLDAWSVDPDVRDRLLGIVEGRCKTGLNGAQWQVDAVRSLEESGIPRVEALRQMVAAYAERMHANQPVHTWEMP
ncbi:glutamate--cysteine ligase [Micropruina sonneratiae]|uniref:glutamate--cysteine ligase n=1 Tax=Micropruina sonneratiae TaxID=2986940 RepID=UPI00222786D3|nr:glutamate--cysteine ligase [Micropruina sp. KQZ13P-5]MCW3158395.1 glutamate--cysteine ligase [Micropruina sp. KQZ13P-5]